MALLAGGWLARTDMFYIAVRCQVDDVGLQAPPLEFGSDGGD